MVGMTMMLACGEALGPGFRRGDGVRDGDGGSWLLPHPYLLRREKVIGTGVTGSAR
jgi:hypothetical protein